MRVYIPISLFVLQCSSGQEKGADDAVSLAFFPSSLSSYTCTAPSAQSNLLFVSFS